ncbi:MAG: asparaginase domain-containing protein [Rhizobiaceae bacterium]
MARDVLVIATGGTIGMAQGPDGLAPEAGLVEAALARLAPPELRLRIERFEPLLDSADINHNHWNRIIDLTVSWQGAGVVVTHGTDTMAYTGAALAFALAGLDRRVVLCGAMRPLGTDGDAESDLLLALSAASGGSLGVWLAIGGRLLAGHALVKRHTSAPDAFAVVADAEPVSQRPGGMRRFANRRLAILTVSPGMPAAALRACLSELDGAILRVYGSGTAPGEVGLVEALADAMAGGKRIFAVSQCEGGELRPGTYASGGPLWQTGMESGGVKTPEAALACLWLDLSAA